MIRPLPLSFVIGYCLVGLTSGCSGGGAAPGGNDGAAPAPPLAYTLCPVASKVGSFALTLVPPTSIAAGYGSFQGGVRNATAPLDVWVELAKDGDCHLVTAPKLQCATPCDGQTCAGQNQCVPAPVAQNLGDVTLGGLAAPVIAKFVGMQYYASVSTPYPPIALRAAVTLTSAGGAYPPLSLQGRGIEPLDFAGNNLQIGRDRSLSVTWTAPQSDGSARIFVRLDIAHHGGVAARVECDVPDTGTATIAASLINKLIDQGTAGFPTLSLTRRTVDSTTIAPGCVEFVVASSVERQVMVDGITSCNDDTQCSSGKTCSVDMTCK